MLMFGAGYVMGTKAGHERYAQIVTMAENASKRLDELGGRARLSHASFPALAAVRLPSRPRLLERQTGGTG